MIKLVSLPILIITLLLFNISNSIINFQKNIWLYWQTDFSQAPFVTQVSYQKLVIAAQKANWTVYLVNDTTIKQYLPDYQGYQKVINAAYRHIAVAKSDILRIWLVQANGGVYFDFACILFQDLSWFTNQKLFQNLIINKLGTNQDDPDMLMLGQEHHSSHISYYNENDILKNNQFYRMAVFFIAAKKNSPMIKAWKQSMNHICTQSYKQMVAETNKKGIYFHDIDRDDMYYSGYLALQSAVQYKQQQLDDKLTLWSGERQNVYEVNKMWLVHAQVGPTAMARKDVVSFGDWYFETREQLQQRTGRLRFYLKVPKYLRQGFEMHQRQTDEYFRRVNITVQQILNRGPTKQQCSLYLIMQGSILYSFYSDSRFKLNTPFITINQRDRLRQYCKYIQPQIHNVIRKQNTKKSQQQIQSQSSQNQESIFSRLSLFCFPTSILKFMWLDWFKRFIHFASVYIGIKYILTKIVRMKIKRHGGQQNGLKLQNFVNSFKIRSIIYKFEIKQLLILIIRLFIISLSMIFYQQIQRMGKYPQYQCTFFLLVIILIFNLILSKYNSNNDNRLQHKLQQNKIINIQQIQVYLRPFYLFIIYCAFIHFDILYCKTYYHTLVIGASLILVYALLQQIDKRKLSNQWLNNIKRLIDIMRYICVGIFSLFIVITNMRYVRYNNKYLKQYISQIANILFWIIITITYVSLLIYLIKVIYKMITNNKQQSLQQNNKSQRQSLHNNQSLPNNQQSQQLQQTQTNTQINKLFMIIKFINITIQLILITINSHNLYQKVIQSPSTYQNMKYLYNFIALFIIVALSIKLNQPYKQSITLKIIHTIISFSLSTFVYLFIFMSNQLFDLTQYSDNSKYITYQIGPQLLITLIVVCQLFFNNNKSINNISINSHIKLPENNQLSEIEINPNYNINHQINTP